MSNKILSLESMKNMSIDRVLELYKDGYRLDEGNGQNQPITMGNTYLGQVAVMYSQAYQQSSGSQMTVDILVRNHNMTTLVLKFKIYSHEAIPVFLSEHIACVQPYNTIQNAAGCTKIRIANVPLSDPYDIHVHRCLNTPVCAAPSCISFDPNYDSSYYSLVGVVSFTGVVPPLTDFPPSNSGLNMAVDCASCEPTWTCETTNGVNDGYKYDSCTGQRVLDTAMCPIPITVADSQISLNASKASPFDKGDIIIFSGILESATWSSSCLCYPNIAGASVHLIISLGGATVVNTTLTTLSGETQPNFIYYWTVPSALVGVDTAGMPIVATVTFSQTSQWKTATATGSYAVTGATCTSIALFTSKDVANVGEYITITALTRPVGTSFSTEIKVDGSILGVCPTSLSPQYESQYGNQYGSQHRNQYESLNTGYAYRINNMADTLSFVSPPTSVVAGQTVNFQLNYSIIVGTLGEWVRFRICSTGSEIGSNIELLYVGLFGAGTATGTISVDAVIPSGATGSISVYADVARNEFSSTCGAGDVVASTQPVSMTISGSLNTMSIIDPPASVVAGQTLDIKLSYNLTVSNFGEWVRFRICSGGVQIGWNNELLFGGSAGTIYVSATIPSNASGSIVIKGEVTTSDLSGTCGDAGVIASTSNRSVSVVSQAPSTISIVHPPTTVRANQSVDIDTSYNVTVSNSGEWVRFRICSGSTEIGHYITLLIGQESGILTINSLIPIGAVGSTVPIKAEISSDELNSTCGAYILASSSIVNIPLNTGLAGTCQMVWNTTGATGGDHYLTARVLGQCATIGSLKITLIAPPPQCTSITIGASSLTPTVGDTVLLTGRTQPLSSGISITFRVNNKVIGSGCTTIAGVCTTNWNTTGLTPGIYKLTSSVESGGTTQCMSSQLSVTLGSPCTSISNVTASPTTATVGASISLTATAQPTTTVFAVSFKDSSGTTIGIVNTVSGVATYSWNTAGKTAGIYNIRASIGTACTSGAATAVTLNPSCTSISNVTAMPTTATIGGTVALTATAQPTTSAFSVSFKDASNTVIGTANTAIGTGLATYNWNTTGKTAGIYQIKASVGAACVSSSTTAVTLNAPAVCTSISNVTATPTTATIGGTVSLTATAQPTTTVFSVSFKDASNTVIGTVNTISGVATYNWNTTGKTAGTYQIKASVGAACTSTTATPVVLNTPQIVCTSISNVTASPTTVTIGGTVALIATTQPTSTVFSVSFKDASGATIGTVNTASGTGLATYNWNTTGRTAGTYQIKASVGTACVSTTATTVTLNAPTVVCTSISNVTATPTTATIGGTIALTATAQPTTTAFVVSFKDASNNIIGTVNTISGVATYNWNTTGRTAGAYQIKASVGTACVSTTATTVTLNTSAVCTSISNVTATPTTATIGEAVSLTATAQPTTSTFSVSFKDASNILIGTANTISGVATYNWNTTGSTVGTYQVKASVGTACESTTAMAVTLNTPSAMCESISIPTASPTTATIGGTVVLTAIAQPTTSVFTVTFKDTSGNTLGNTTTISGVATYNWNTTGKTAGIYPIKASVGTACISSSAIVVTLEAPTAACTSISNVTALPTTGTIGETILLTVTAQPTTSTFTVAFKDAAGTIIGAANTANGIAEYSWITTDSAPGTYQIRASVGTACTSQSATSVTLNQVITPCMSITVPTATPTTVTIGGTVTLEAITSPTTDMFAVSFKDQYDTILGTANTVAGVATLDWNTTDKTSGIYQIRALVVGTSCISDTAVSITLSEATTACTSISVITATPSTANIGEVITISATAEPTTATFTVDFKDQSGSLIGSANTESGVASYVWNTSYTIPGPYWIKAYIGTVCISADATQATISPQTTACISVTIPTTTPNSVSAGDIVELKATVEPTTSIFFVTFREGNITIGSANTVNGVATSNWNTTGKTAGTYQVRAYAGNCVSPSAAPVTISGGTANTGSITFIINDAGQPLEGVLITVDSMTIGTTGSNGRLASPVTGLSLGNIHFYTATKSGYADQSGSRTLTITNTIITIDMSGQGGGGDSGGGMVFGLIGVVALGMMMSSKKPPSSGAMTSKKPPSSSGLVGFGKVPIE